MALYRKLGGDNEASRIMGKATQSIASHFATQEQIDQVTLRPCIRPRSCHVQRLDCCRLSSCRFFALSYVSEGTLTLH